MDERFGEGARMPLWRGRIRIVAKVSYWLTRLFPRQRPLSLIGTCSNFKNQCWGLGREHTLVVPL